MYLLQKNSWINAYMLYLWTSSNMYFYSFASMNEIFRHATSMIYFTTHGNNGKF